MDHGRPHIVVAMRLAVRMIVGVMVRVIVGMIVGVTALVRAAAEQEHADDIDTQSKHGNRDRLVEADRIPARSSA